MTALAPLGPDDRLLILAPHPDDETIATGVLIQVALQAGAALRIVFATDGDNNPWPQRWIERRWHIGARERARWGERRRQEVSAALRVLGVDAQATRFLGWPDQGLTERLMRDDEAVTILAGEIRAFAPTHVALPALADRHPDHGALRVLGDLALLRAECTATRLSYVIHGDGSPVDAYVAPGDEARLQCKRQALLAHASQLVLSRQRMLGLAGQPERFDILDAAGSLPPVQKVGVCIRIAYRPGHGWRRRRDLLLVLVTHEETMRFRFVLPRWVTRGSRVALDAGRGRVFQAQWAENTWILTLPQQAAPLLAIYVKLDRRWPRLILFDKECWHEGASLLPGGAEASFEARTQGSQS
ncbi:MAG: PIG-L family deacetylase [Rhodanobacter sp.]|jgi:LmbE family N-acetylglucosaminyl deacetylase|nr:PIG-L family deacetylase [Rhodanobacter sp.]